MPLLLVTACGTPAPAPLPPDSFAFAVFGDGPYRSWENGRFRAVIRDVNRSDIAWFLHVGDLFWYPCSDEHFEERLRQLQSIRHPVVYTPGDNEWTDCHERIAGGYVPLDRLEKLRAAFYPSPGTTLGTPPLRVETESADTAWSEFVENVRWVRGGFLFATVHMVGSGNATAPFAGRTPDDDRESVRRTAAAMAWLDGTFDLAERTDARGVVIAMHGDPDFENGPDDRSGYAAFIGRLRDRTLRFDGPVLLIHGDSHELIVDHPLLDPDTGDTIPDFTRLETFGSPDIGWVRVVIDSVAGRITAFEPRLVPRWRLW
ncbi:MAG: metallophosphoesterase [Gemmatimonadota bacterium]